jgi:hypothetical protein
MYHHGFNNDTIPNGNSRANPVVVSFWIRLMDPSMLPVFPCDLSSFYKIFQKFKVNISFFHPVFYMMREMDRHSKPLAKHHTTLATPA